MPPEDEYPEDVEELSTNSQPDTENPEVADEQETEPEFLTRDQFEAEWQQREQDLLRRVQSMTGKAESRITRQFQQLQAGNQRALEIAKQMGLTPQQMQAYEASLRNDAMQRALGEQGDGPPPNGHQPPDPQFQQPAQTEVITDRGVRMMVESGLEKTDPELALIVTDGTPEEYFGSIKAASKAKAQRLTSGQSTKERQPAKPARVPGLGPNGQRAKNDDWRKSDNVDELLDEEWKLMTRSS